MAKISDSAKTKPQRVKCRKDCDTVMLALLTLQILRTKLDVAEINQAHVIFLNEFRSIFTNTTAEWYNVPKPIKQTFIK